MAIGVVKLSEVERRRLLIVLIALCVVQALLGGAIILPSVYIFIAVAPLAPGDSPEVRFVFATTGLFGTHVIANWLVGISMCQRCFYQAKKKSTRNLLLLWCCTGSHTVINLIVIAALSRKLNRQIGRAMKNSIQSSMKNYLRDDHVKLSMDELQYYQGCCGVYGYTDWQLISWMTKYEVDINSEVFKEYREGDENMHLPVIPWSCCRLEFPMQCLHDPLQQQLFSHLWKNEPSVVASSINSNGCLHVIWYPVTVVLSLLTILMSLVTILHVLIFCLIRILYTSCRNLVLLDDPHGISPGWIFGRGDCGYVRGDTLSQIMMGVNQTRTPRRSTSKTRGPHSSAQSVCRAVYSEAVNVVFQKIAQNDECNSSEGE